MTAAATAHPFPEYPDSHPYVLCVDSDCILVNFGVEPFIGACFDDHPYQSNLIVVRDYNCAGVEQGRPITATAERIPPRDAGLSVVRNVESLGIIYGLDRKDYVIAELVIDKRSEHATLLYFTAGLHGKWIQEFTNNPLPLYERDRDWIPSGVVSYDKMLWRFDLSWGLISYDPMLETQEAPLLLFHHLPEGHDLTNRAQRVHDRRCIAVSRGGLRYVAITPEADAAAVSMWTRIASDADGWIWDREFTVTFADIWEHDSYTATGLPRKVPVLVAVCPSNPNMVYFALEDLKRIFAVNTYSRRVEEFIDVPYELLRTGPEAPPSCRYVLPWSLPLEAAALRDDPVAGDAQELIDEEELETWQTKCTSQKSWCDLPRDIVESILVRLTVSDLMRFRGVCTRWNECFMELVSQQAFIEEHHRRQAPARPVIRLTSDPHCFEDLVDVRLEALDPGNCGHQVLASFRHWGDELEEGSDAELHFRVHATCDGLLLINSLDSLYLCNPATRQWAPLPPLRATDIKALYASTAHGSRSGDYRILFRSGDVGPYYAVSTGTHGVYMIEDPPPDEFTAYLHDRLARGLPPAYQESPALVEGRLHWPPEGWEDEQHTGPCVVVFDTETELFGCMGQPPAFNDYVHPEEGRRCHLKMFEFNGKLALSCLHLINKIEVWVLVDYSKQEWVLSQKITVPPPIIHKSLSAYVISSEEHCIFLYHRFGAILFKKRQFVFEYAGCFKVRFFGHMYSQSLFAPPVPAGAPMLAEPPFWK